MSDPDHIRFCPHCKLQYRPDPRQHVEPEEFCPRCGKRLIPLDEDKSD